MRVRLPYIVCLVAGLAIGVGFGGGIFPQLEVAFGEPLTDIFLGIVGVVFAAIAYEAVAMLWDPTDTGTVEATKVRLDELKR